jgi:hypothetical protein
MSNSKIKKVPDEKKKIVKVKKETPKPELVSFGDLPIKFLKTANRGGKALTFHSGWFNQDDARKKKSEIEVNGGHAVIVIHAKLGARYFAIYEIMKKVG